MCGCKGKCGCNIISTTKGDKGDASPVASLGYKEYIALLTQTGTNAPTVTVLKNTLGGTVVWTRNGIGDYIGTLASAFPLDKTWISSSGISGSATTIGQFYKDSVNNVGFLTYDGVASDDLLYYTSVEIRVYP